MNKKDKKVQEEFFENAKNLTRVAFGSKGWPTDWVEQCECMEELAFVSTKLMAAIRKHPDVAAIKIHKDENGWNCSMIGERYVCDDVEIPQAGKLKDFDTLMKSTKNGKN